MCIILFSVSSYSSSSEEVDDFSCRESAEIEHCKEEASPHTEDSIAVCARYLDGDIIS